MVLSSEMARYEEQAHDISLLDIMEDIAPTQITFQNVHTCDGKQNVFVTICGTFPNLSLLVSSANSPWSMRLKLHANARAPGALRQVSQIFFLKQRQRPAAFSYSWKSERWLVTNRQ